MSGLAAAGWPLASLRARMKQPPWLMPTASGPARRSSQARPMPKRPNQPLSWSLVGMGGRGARGWQQPGQAHAQAAEPAIELVVGGDGLGALVAETNLQVVLQVLADAGQF